MALRIFRPKPDMTDRAHSADDAPAMQKSQPKGRDGHGEPYEPIEIPVPRKVDVLRDLAKGAKPEPDRK